MADKQPSEGQRQASYAKDAELRQICDANAISQETFVQDSLPAELEIAFLTVSSLVGASILQGARAVCCATRRVRVRVRARVRVRVRARAEMWLPGDSTARARVLFWPT